MLGAALLIVAGYLLGSIPFGFLVGKLCYGVDIRTKGSGNIGTANALRTFGKPTAAGVLVLDAAKGFGPTFAAHAWYGPAVAAAVALAAVLGHVYSPWLRFHGGKGVATSLGAIFGLSWIAGLACVGAWLLAGLGSGYSSVGSLAASIVAPLALLIATRQLPQTVYGLLSALLIVYTHRENIARLRGGRENPIRLFSRGAPE